MYLLVLFYYINVFIYCQLFHLYRICDVNCNNMLLYISIDPYIVNQLIPYPWKLHIDFRVRGIQLILSINHFDVLKLRVYEFAFDQTIWKGLRYVRIFLVDLYMTLSY